MVRTLGSCAIAAAILVSACAAPGARDASDVASPSAAAPATSQASVRPTTTPRTTAETEAWALIRSTMPAGIPVAQPTWLPPWIDRSRVALTDLRGNAQDPRYTVTYFSSSSGRVELVMGIGPIDPPDAAASGLGTRVRGVPATLAFPSSLLVAGPVTQGQRRLRWAEGKYVLRIDSETIAGDDLLHVAWSLDPAGRPAPQFPYARARAGACSRTESSPEAVVATALALMGGHDRDAMLDCFASDWIGSAGPDPLGAWADLPAATVTTSRSPDPIGGRVQILVAWTFAADPGGAWGPRPLRSFLVGMDGDRQRIYEVGSAPLPHLP